MKCYSSKPPLVPKFVLLEKPKLREDHLKLMEEGTANGVCSLDFGVGWKWVTCVASEVPEAQKGKYSEPVDWGSRPHWLSDSTVSRTTGVSDSEVYEDRGSGNTGSPERGRQRPGQGSLGWRWE